MLLVIADTSPIRYLIQIDLIDVLPRLFDKIFIPSIVADELSHPSAPATVQGWMKRLPGWVEVLPVAESDDPVLAALDPGEKSAIALGLSLKADLILIDDRKGAAAALGKGFEVTGTLGILDLAARRGMADLGDALRQLTTHTNFRYRQTMIDEMLERRPQQEKE